MYNIEHIYILLARFNSVAQVRYSQGPDMYHHLTVKFVDLTTKHLHARTFKELYTVAEVTCTHRSQ